MDYPRIVLLGKNGQLGRALQRSLAPLGELIALGRDGWVQPDGCVWAADLEQPQQLQATLERLQPALIVNAAAFTAVDRAQSQPELVERVNVHAVEAMAQAALKLDAALLHFSSDYVFSGAGDVPWREADASEPVNVYGASKLAGEQVIAHSGVRHVTLRTSWVCGEWGDNFVRTMLRLALQRESIAVVADQFGAPTSAQLLADVSAHVARVLLSQGARPRTGHSAVLGQVGDKSHALAADDVQLRGFDGIYHCAAAGVTNWCALARFAIAHAQHIAPQLPWKLRDVQRNVQAITSAQWSAQAPRPANSRLDCTRLQAHFGLRLPAWEDGVQQLVQALVGQLALQQLALQ